MANAKYSQVTQLLAQGRLNWPSNLIEAKLVTGGTFNGSHTKLSQVGSTLVASELIYGRTVAPNGECLGFSVLFPTAEADVPYRVVVTQDLGTGDPDVLLWYDTAEGGGTLEMENTGTLVIRPQVPATVPDGISTEARVWMRV